jgi:3-mercaptopyruvate sulfurtransferase SseA
VALVLKRNGITRVRPLQGGLTLWMDRQFPLEDLVVERNGTLDTRAVTP